MSAAWTPSRDLRDATDEALRLWRINHPNRRVPKDHDHDAERYEFARAFSVLPIGSITIVAEQVLDVSQGHFPNPTEVRKSARAFLHRQNDRTMGWGQAHPLDDTTAIDAQCDAILRGLGMTDSALSGASKARGIAVVMEAIMDGVMRAVDAGTMPRTRLAELRAGTYPTPAQLERDAMRLSEKGKQITKLGRPT